MTRRDLSDYQRIDRAGLELYVLPPLVEHADTLNIKFKKLLFFKSITAEFEMPNGLVLGRRGATA